MTREEAIDLLDNLIGFIEDNHGSDYDEALKIAIEALELVTSYEGTINKLTEALNQKKEGHWIDCEDLGDDGIEYWCECSECHSERAYKTNFCPDCGARMREGEIDG